MGSKGAGPFVQSSHMVFADRMILANAAVERLRKGMRMDIDETGDQAKTRAVSGPIARTLVSLTDISDFFAFESQIAAF